MLGKYPKTKPIDMCLPHRIPEKQISISVIISSASLTLGYTNNTASKFSLPLNSAPSYNQEVI